MFTLTLFCNVEVVVEVIFKLAMEGCVTRVKYFALIEELFDLFYLHFVLSTQLAAFLEFSSKSNFEFLNFVKDLLI